MKRREHWQVEAVLLAVFIAGLIGLYLTRGTPDY
jgi:hypothetical protein